VIVLVAVVMLFVVGAMAAISIDVVTLYTARSEAQLAADAAALAAARVIANSGATSASDLTLLASIEAIPGGLAQTIAIQVGQNSMVGGRNLVAANGEITVSFSGSSLPFNPHVTVQTKRTDLPAFFARIWGNTQLTVAASATAEAYNPSGGAGISGGAPPVAPICVKPWLLPNLDPSNTGSTTAQIFDPTSGTVLTQTLLGWNSITSPGGVPLTLACTSPNGTCTAPLPNPPLQAWTYFPGDDATTFPHPSQPSCTPALTTNYQASVAGCIQVPISCSSPSGSPANIDMTTYTNPSRNSDTADAVNCLTHATNNKGDTVPFLNPVAPFQFVAGGDDPIVLSGTMNTGAKMMVSDSLVTVPVFDPTTYTSLSASVPIIGFVQLFLNPDGNATLESNGNVNTTVTNIVGCGTNNTVQPIIGNGASPVAVRLISGP